MTPLSTPQCPPVQTEPAAIPEHMAILLLEGGQRFLTQLADAIRGDDPRLMDHFTRKAFAILDELHRRLNHEQGGELVENLIRLYAWWRGEIAGAVKRGEVERLARVRIQMGDIRQAWEQVLFKGAGMSEGPKL